MHMGQLMPLPHTVSCFSKILIGFTFLAPTHPQSSGTRAIKQAYICMYLIKINTFSYKIDFTNLYCRHQLHVKVCSKVTSESSF